VSGKIYNWLSEKASFGVDFEMGETEQELNRQLTVAENFYSSRTVAHASFFVASIFGSFTILALMKREFVSSVLLSIIYWLVFLFGVFSFLNFSRYAIRAQIAEGKTANEAETFIKQELEKPNTRQDKLIRQFDRTRASPEIANIDKFLFLIAYSAVALVAFVAVWLR
jgi:hypothetical protein